MKMCVLTEGKVCNDCGECNRCDLDPNKICDNCMKCVQTSDADYGEIVIDEVASTDESMKEILQQFLAEKDREEAEKKDNA